MGALPPLGCQLHFSSIWSTVLPPTLFAHFVIGPPPRSTPARETQVSMARITLCLLYLVVAAGNRGASALKQHHQHQDVQVRLPHSSSYKNNEVSRYYTPRWLYVHSYIYIYIRSNNPWRRKSPTQPVAEIWPPQHNIINHNNRRRVSWFKRSACRLIWRRTICEEIIN